MDLKGFQGITSQAAPLELICLLQIQEPLWTNHSIWPVFTSRYIMDKKLSNPIFLTKLICLSLRSFIIGGRRWTIFQHAWSIFQKWCQYFKKICDVFEVLWAFLLKCQKLYLTAMKHFFWNYEYLVTQTIFRISNFMKYQKNLWNSKDIFKCEKKNEIPKIF